MSTVSSKNQESKSDKPEEKSIEDLRSRVKNVRIAMLTTMGKSGKMHSRPMGTNEMDVDGTVWFFTRESSLKVDEIESNSHVCLTYANPSDNVYVCLQGQATIVKDKAKMAELFNPMVKVWFPDGLEDPELTLLKVEPSDAEYWDGPSSSIVFAARAIKALVTGDTMKSKEGEHGRVTLS